MKISKSLRIALTAVLLAPFAASADVIVDYPLDNNAGFGWNSNRGAQQIAEAFSVTDAASANTVSWYGFWQGVGSETFDILFYNDDGGTPDAVAFASETVNGIGGVNTGLTNPSGNEIYHYTASISSVLLGLGDYWISVRGVDPTIFTWSHSSSDGTGNVYARFSDDGAWEEFGAGTRDQQVVRIEGVKVPEPGTLALLGLGLVALGANRRRKKA